MHRLRRALTESQSRPQLDGRPRAQAAAPHYCMASALSLAFFGTGSWGGRKGRRRADHVRVRGLCATGGRGHLHSIYAVVANLRVQSWLQLLPYSLQELSAATDGGALSTLSGRIERARVKNSPPGTRRFRLSFIDLGAGGSWAQDVCVRSGNTWHGLDNTPGAQRVPSL